jgi:hypothetical protein
MGDEIRVNKSVPIIPQKNTLKPGKREDQQEHKHKDEAGDHFQQLSSAARLANDVLERDKSPYRFRVYKEGEDVFIDIVIVDKNGTIMEAKQKNITHEEFSTWLNHIEQGNGLFFDITA